MYAVYNSDGELIGHELLNIILLIWPERDIAYINESALEVHLYVS